VTSRPRRARLAGARVSSSMAADRLEVEDERGIFFRSSPMLLCFHFLFYALFDVSRGSFMLAPGSYG